MQKKKSHLLYRRKMCHISVYLQSEAELLQCLSSLGNTLWSLLNLMRQRERTTSFLSTQHCMDYNVKKHAALHAVKNSCWCGQAGGRRLLKIN